MDNLLVPKIMFFLLLFAISSVTISCAETESFIAIPPEIFEIQAGDLKTDHPILANYDARNLYDSDLGDIEFYFLQFFNEDASRVATFRIVIKKPSNEIEEITRLE